MNKHLSKLMTSLVVLAGVLLATKPAAASPVAPGVYVVSNATHQILQYDNTNGTFYSVYATLSASADLRGMALGPDGQLYVADARTGANGGVYSIGGGGVVTQVLARDGATDVDWNGNDLFVDRGNHKGIVEKWTYPSFTTPTYYTLAAGQGASQGNAAAADSAFLNYTGYNDVEFSHVYPNIVRYSKPTQPSGQSIVQSDSTPGNFATIGPGASFFDMEYRHVGTADYFYTTPQNVGTVDLWILDATSLNNVNGILAPGAYHRMNYRDIAFNSAGDVLMTSATNDIVKYSAGGVWSTFIASGSGGLSSGQGIVFVIPEPASLALVAVGAAAMLTRRKRNG